MSTTGLFGNLRMIVILGQPEMMMTLSSRSLGIRVSGIASCARYSGKTSQMTNPPLLPMVFLTGLLFSLYICLVADDVSPMYTGIWFKWPVAEDGGCDSFYGHSGLIILW